MLKISQKRSRDWTEDLPRETCHFSPMVIEAPSPMKRARAGAAVESPLRTSSFRNDSPFLQQQEEKKEEPLEEFLQPKEKRKIIAKKETQERLFTYEQVREIVNRALAEREGQLRMEYDKILQEKLQEQFQNFAKFNEDYISRQFKQTDFSYLS